MKTKFHIKTRKLRTSTKAILEKMGISEISVELAKGSVRLTTPKKKGGYHRTGKVYNRKKSKRVLEE